MAKAIGSTGASCIWTLHFCIFSFFDLPFGLVVARVIGGEICDLHLAVLHFCSVAFFLHVSPCPRWVVGGAIGDTGATTQQREGGRLLEEKQAVQRHGRAGGAVAPTHTLRCRHSAADL